MSKILVGTSGYDYPEWKGVFYPKDLRRSDFLSYYSTQFDALELNNTFYNMPTAERMNSFVQRSEGRLLFSVKANRLLTHQIGRDWKNAADDFLASIKPMASKGLLGAALFQFPQSFRYEKQNRFYLSELLKAFCGLPLVVEFRHREWIRPSVFEGLAERKVSVAFCDMPALKALPAAQNEKALYTQFIGPLAYIRLHGRNAAAWYAKDDSPNGSSRYNYDYSDEELESFAPVINSAQNEGRQVQVYFNNHPDGKGAKNAKSLKRMLANG